MPIADAKLMNRIQRVARTLDRLERDLQEFGDRDAADAVKRARREFELVMRLGVFTARGQELNL